MKKKITLILLSVLLATTLVASPVLSKEEDKGTQGQPFQELYDAIAAAVAQIEQMVAEVQEGLEDLISEVEQSIEQMVEDAVSTLEEQLEGLQAQLDSEQAARIDADAATASAAQAANDALQALITADIANEEAARIDADSALQADIDAEEAARLSADATLQVSINDEADSRFARDDNLQNQINSILMPKMWSRQFKALNTNYYAATDGFVVVSVWNASSAWGVSDSSSENGYYGLIAKQYDSETMTVPIPKGRWWKVVTTNTEAWGWVQWVPYH